MGFEKWPEHDAQQIKGASAVAELPDGAELVDRLKKIVARDAALVETYAQVWAPKGIDD